MLLTLANTVIFILRRWRQLFLRVFLLLLHQPVPQVFSFVQLLFITHILPCFQHLVIMFILQMLEFSLIVHQVVLLQPWLLLQQQISRLSPPLRLQILVYNLQLRCLPLPKLHYCFILKRRDLPLGTFQRRVLPRNLLPSLRGLPPKIPTSDSSLLQLLPPHSSVVVISGQTSPTVVAYACGASFGLCFFVGISPCSSSS